ncbi:MAG TPA: FtsX-like permease family protein [Cyclobacteriaceae bacterium]|nr:FtsX-like permease family protein [Cyclobacteriaceae bacterium]
MNLSLFIARRYLFSKRKKNFINVISIIAAFLVAVITAAIIVVLSIFNGLGDLIRGLNNSFDPEIKIVAVKGKSFVVTPELLTKIKSIRGVDLITEVIEDYAYVEFNDASQVVIMKGVSQSFVDENRIPSKNMIYGKMALKEGDTQFAVVGYGVKYTLSVEVDNNFHPLNFYYVKNSKGGSIDPSKLYTKRSIMPGGVFSIMQSFDENYILVPLEFARELMNYGERRTSLEIKTKTGSNTEAIEKSLQASLGNNFDVLNQDEQHADLYRVLRLEKLFSSLASIILLVIGSVSVYLSLMLLALDKKKDITVLSALGANRNLIRNVFLMEGVLISLIGTLTGIVAGCLIVFLQQKFSLVSMGMAHSVTEGYPITLVYTDVLYVLIMMVAVTIIISFRPAVVASRFVSVQNL